MAMLSGRSISKTDIAKMQKRITSLQSRAKNAVAQAEGIMESVVQTTEVGVAALGLGLIQGRYGADATSIQGVPLDLVAAVALHGAALLGVGGEMKSHMHNFGNGALASYLNTVGRGLGIGISQGEPSRTTTRGQSGSDVLSDRELADL